MRKVWGVVFAAGISLCAVVAGLILHLPRIRPDWGFRFTTGSSEFNFARWNGGAVLASGSTLRWLDANGKLLSTRSIAPDRLNFPIQVGNEVASGTHSGAIVLFDANGNLRWRNQVGKRPCTVAAGPGRELWAIESNPRGAQSVTVLTAQGRTLRRFPLAGRLNGWPTPLISPAGMLIGDGTTHKGQSFNTVLVAYDSAGRQRWKQSLGGRRITEVVLGPGASIYCVAHQDKVFRIDPNTGKPSWSFANPHPVLGVGGFHWYDIYALPNGNMLVVSDGRAFCFDAQCNLLWERALGDYVGSCVVLGDGSFYTTTGRNLIPLKLRSEWAKYQLRQGKPQRGVQQPTLRDSHALILVKTDGRVQRLGRLEAETVLFGRPGPAGELYGWNADFTASQPTYTISRLTP